jgi:hypothetical protein
MAHGISPRSQQILDVLSTLPDPNDPATDPFGPLDFEQRQKVEDLLIDMIISKGFSRMQASQLVRGFYWSGWHHGWDKGWDSGSHRNG